MTARSDVSGRVTVVRRADWVPAAWRNGGGVAHELFRLAGADGSLHWRISVAVIERAGPFSVFAGVDRTTALLRGAGVRLHANGSPPLELSPAAPLVHYAGDEAIACDPIEPPLEVLNVMVTRGHATASVRRAVVAAQDSFGDGQSTVFLHCIDGSLLCEGVALGPDDSVCAGGPLRCFGPGSAWVAELRPQRARR